MISLAVRQITDFPELPETGHKKNKVEKFVSKTEQPFIEKEGINICQKPR